MKTRICQLLTLVSLAAALPSAARAQEAADYFRENCFSCHTIGGGRLTGPDLQNVTERRNRDWLVQFILDPLAVLESGDPYAEQILEESRGVIMPSLVGITADRANSLLDLVEAESQLPESQFRGIEVSDRPFTPADVELGAALFSGGRPLANGGPSCLACHTVRGLSGLSGGRLGPDLTVVYGKYGDRQTLAAWLAAPATNTMLPIYKRHPLASEEVLPLVAFLEKTAQEGGADQSVAILSFFFLGLGGTVLVLAIFDAIWKGRFRGARAALVRQHKSEVSA